MVDWISVCQSKRNGGLGIGRISDKNVSLLANGFGDSVQKIRLYGNAWSTPSMGFLMRGLDRIGTVLLQLRFL